MKAVGFSCTGKVRSHNEDCASVNGSTLRPDSAQIFHPTDQSELLLVADGMGGHARGDVASSLAIELLNSRPNDLLEAGGCVDVLRLINRKIYDAMARDEKLLGMGTTIAGILIHKNDATWFNVGDSRIYLYRNGFLRQISVDHIPTGATGPKGRATHAITQSLGGSPRWLDIWPSFGILELQKNDVILLCSDGLTDVISDEQICQILTDVPVLEMAVTALIHAVMEGGAPDNVTVLATNL